MSDYKENGRYLLDSNGRQFAATWDGYQFISDIDGQEIYEAEASAEELTDLRAAKVGDLITDGEDAAKILAIDYTHSVFLRSTWGHHNITSAEWRTWGEAERSGWKLVYQVEDITELTLKEVAELKGIPVEKLKVIDG